LYSLLARVLRFLKSNNWDTRNAAALAVEAISKEVTEWDPPTGSQPDDMDEDGEEDLMTFSGLDLLSVVKNGVKLLGSSGKEFIVDLDGLDPKERVKKQKELLKQKLGLGTMDVEFFNEEDLIASPVVETKPEVAQNISGLSSRERNRLKRKAKQAAKGGGRGEKYDLLLIN
jgi:TATA-binding protein-associated factor